MTNLDPIEREKLQKLLSLSNDEGMKLHYDWIKKGHINLKLSKIYIKTLSALAVDDVVNKDAEVETE